MSENEVKVRFYSTRSCHLCEKASAILDQADIANTRIDIGSNITLLKEYGMRIPVLQRLDNGMELDWPFDSEDVNNFLR